MRWRLPRWALSVAGALVTDRAVQARIGGWRGRARALRRSVGVGGPPSALMWNMGYDPIVEAI
eukprot:9764438-Lingulodinium_polyedra.AAC.1